MKDGCCIFGSGVFIIVEIGWGRLNSVIDVTPCGIGEDALFPFGIGKECVCEFVCDKILFNTSCVMQFA